MSKRPEPLKKAQDKYDTVTCVVRIDIETYDNIRTFSENNNIAFKNTVRMAMKAFKESDFVKQDNERLKIEIDLLKKLSDNNATINDTIKMALDDIRDSEHIKQENGWLKTENDLLKKEVEQLKTENDLLKGKEKKGLKFW